ncbi:MAG: hypothetical protein JNL61_11400 [Rhizobiaceae bacterium]|nr:hypothetical protein [Rhizobiaceae bacterium]
MADSKNGGRYWTAGEIERAKVEGARIAKWLKEHQRPCLRGCLCSICGGDPAKQEPREDASSKARS